MKVVVGLGNPGKKYAQTPHNMGFIVVDELAKRFSSTLRRSFRFKAHVGKAAFNGGKILLAKPQTYMNNSGTAVASILRYHKVASEDMILVVDDADLDFGRLRIRADGGTGGHNGIDSVISNVGSDKFTRIRVGVGRANDSRSLEKQVLSSFSAEEKKEMMHIVDRAAEAVVAVLEQGVDKAMNEFNGK